MPTSFSHYFCLPSVKLHSSNRIQQFLQSTALTVIFSWRFMYAMMRVTCMYICVYMCMCTHIFGQHSQCKFISWMTRSQVQISDTLFWNYKKFLTKARKGNWALKFSRYTNETLQMQVFPTYSWSGYTIIVFILL